MNKGENYFRYKLGNYEITSIYDGFSAAPTAFFVGDKKESKFKNAINYLIKTGKIITKADVNTFLVNTKNNLILIDVGGGNSLGPMMGKTKKNLLLSGYKIEDVDKILLTHLHPDHIGGLSVNGKMIYTNATIYINKSELEYWLREENINKYIKMALDPYMKNKQYKVFEDGEEIVVGVKAILLTGHTVGHTGFEVTSKNEKMLFWGDIIHDQEFQFSHMDKTIVLTKYDQKRVAQEIKVTKETVNKAEKEKELIAGAHLPFPGIGYIEKTGTDGVNSWVPVD